jgi:hypothetical protein
MIILPRSFYKLLQTNIIKSKVFWAILFSSTKWLQLIKRKRNRFQMAISKFDLSKCVILPFVGIFLFCASGFCQESKQFTLENVVIVTSDGENSGERIAALVLAEEVEKRTGLKWVVTKKDSKSGNRIFLTLKTINDSRNLKPEGYHLKIDKVGGEINIIISGADGRGLLYGVGKLLRMLDWKKGSVNVPKNVDIFSSPAYPIRGHQIGYRTLANSYDAWTPEIYEQYIRELALFGTNSIEIVPFSGRGPLMKVDPHVMNVAISEICEKYDMDFWIMTGVGFDLVDKVKAATVVEKHKKLYDACTRLDAVFFAGGDPGISHPKHVMPLLEELAEVLKQKHPDAKIWFSLQDFDEEETDFFFNYINANMPVWFGGLVHGPASPSMPDSRNRLPEKYKLRHYPDITHSCRSQYPVSWWDPALARTLGRECPNPQPVYYSLIHNWFAPFTDGSISYSDGMHDDVNKIIWSARGWDPDINIRDVLKDYARFFFRPDVAESIADGILALENNWTGALVHNGSVETTQKFWQYMAKEAPELDDNWRWQLCQIRSQYDAYIRRRVIYERALEERVNNILAKAAQISADSAIEQSREILNLAVTAPVAVELRNDIEAAALSLYNSIGFQTSVEKYGAIGLNRGAIIDYLDMPMNNRHWLEDEFDKIQKFSTEKKKLEQLIVIANWENPGEGSFYDDLGTLDRSTHLVRGEGLETDPLMQRNPNPGFWYWDEGFNRMRLSQLVSMDRPVAVVYEHINPTADYDVRVTGYRVANIQMNGEWIEPFVFSDEKGAIVEYHVPSKAIKSGKLVLNWGDPEITEIWLIKK